MRRILFFISCACMFYACKKPEAVTNLNNNQVAVVGHAGSGIPGLNSDFPIDSYEGAVHALEFYNADGVELDIQLTADSVLFMYHDRELESLTNCSGCSFYFQSGDMEQCTFKPTSTTVSEPYYVTRLEKVISRYSNAVVKPVIFLDLHLGLGCDITDTRKEWYYSTTLYAINALVAKYNAYDYVLVQANSFDWMKEARDKFPALKVFLDGPIGPNEIAQAVDNGFYGVASKDEDITKEEVTLAHSKGLRVQIYGARGSFAGVINKFPDYILTDNIPLLQNTLNY